MLQAFCWCLLFFVAHSNYHACSDQVDITCKKSKSHHEVTFICFVATAKECDVWRTVGFQHIQIRHEAINNVGPPTLINDYPDNDPFTISSQELNLNFACGLMGNDEYEEEEWPLIGVVDEECNTVKWNGVVSVQNHDFQQRFVPELQHAFLYHLKGEEIEETNKYNKEFIEQHTLIGAKYKSKQGNEGDCQLHSLNNALYGPYLTNWVMGQYVDPNKLLIEKEEATDLEIDAKKRAHEINGRIIDAVAIYKKTDYENIIKRILPLSSKPINYEVFSNYVVENWLNVFNMEEELLRTDLYGKDAVDNLMRELYSLSIANEPRTVGLRFCYWSSTEGRHAVGIHLEPESHKLVKTKKGTEGDHGKHFGRHWLWTQSWENVKHQLYFNDIELADYLINGFPQDPHNFHKRIFVIFVKPRLQKLSPPKISTALIDMKLYHLVDKKLYDYWKCIDDNKSKVEYIDHIETLEKHCSDKLLMAHTEYRNDYHVYGVYKDDNNYDEELRELSEIDKLKDLRSKEKLKIKLLRTYNLDSSNK